MKEIDSIITALKEQLTVDVTDMSVEERRALRRTDEAAYIERLHEAHASALADGIDTTGMSRDEFKALITPEMAEARAASASASRPTSPATGPMTLTSPP